MRDWRDASLGRDETVLNTFKGGLEFMGTDKAISGILVLTNRKIIFLEKKEYKIFSAAYEKISSAALGRTRHPSVLISLLNTEKVRFFTGNKKLHVRYAQLFVNEYLQQKQSHQ